MIALFWGCFAAGILFALATLLLGDLFHTDHLHFLEPVSVVSGITLFGGAGILFTRYSPLTAGSVMVLSLLLAVLASIAIYFLYVKRMKQAENSTGFSIYDLTGKIGEVTTTVPANGYGEVLVAIGAGRTNQIAASFDREELKEGTRIVVVEVREDTLYVSPLGQV